MKAYVVNFNGVLDGVLASLRQSGEVTDSPHDADVFVLWQDVRGAPLELARIAKEHLGKPVVVVQHGRGATRDYGAPNAFPLLADHICVWGEAEKARLVSFAIHPDKITVTGCPLFSRLRPRIPRQKRDGTNVLFVPIIAEHEEPENLLVFATLKKWEQDRFIESLYEKFPKLKESWATEENNYRRKQRPDGTFENVLWQKRIINGLPRGVTYDRGLINVKLTGVHDLPQYMAPVVATRPDDPRHVDVTAELLANTDAMVCLEEGTMQLLASALDIPIIRADIFKYGMYGGIDYSGIEMIRTNACYGTNKLDKIPGLLSHALSHPEELRKARIKVCEHEGGAHLGNADANIIAAVRRVAESKEPAAV